MGAKFTGKAGHALTRALEIARGMGHTYIGTEHILLGLLGESDCIASGVLESGGMNYESACAVVKKAAGTGEPSRITPADLTPKAKKAIEDAAKESAGGRSGYIGTEHLLYAILSDPDCFGYKTVTACGASALSLKAELAIFVSPELSSKKKQSKGVIAGAPTLSKYGVSLVDAARNGECDPVIGRERECERLMQILARRTKNNPCLIGEPGVGKTAIVEGLAALIAEGRAPDTLKGRNIVMLDITSMIAGAKYRGEFEERMKSVMEEARRDKSVILFIDEVHTITGAGAAEGAVDAANILKPSLSRGEIQIIGATTLEEYRRHIEKDAALARRFQPVTVREPTPAESVRILKGLRKKYEAHHGLEITDDAIGAAVDLSVRYMKDRYLPDKAIDLIDESASRVRIEASEEPPEIRAAAERIHAAENEQKGALLSGDLDAAEAASASLRSLMREYRELSEHGGEKKKTVTVSAKDVEKTLTQRTGIPVSSPGKEEEERMSGLEDEILSSIVGQDEAVKAVCRAVKRGRIGIKDPDRPSAVFLFVGPTGVGKTELAKALARALFRSSGGLIRFDMSEYSEKYSISKLIGSPPGYVGYGDAARLTESVRRSPYSVVLFDEIEKAHPDVLNLLLQIMEDGRLTDSLGRECDFRNTVIIMTSNARGEKLTENKCLGFSAVAENDLAERAKKGEVERELKKVFSPEFIGRTDEIIIFGPLRPKDISAIAEKYLRETSARLARLGVSIEFDSSVAAAAASATDHTKYGARPLRKTVTTLVDDVIAEEILNGGMRAGDSIVCSCDADGLHFEKTKSGAKSKELSAVTE